MINTIIETFTSLPETASTALILILLVTVFAIAYKTLALVIQTTIITALSAAFYITLWYLDYMPFSFRNLLLFAFLGAAIYITLKVLETAYTLTKTTIKVPVEIIEAVYHTLEFAKNTIQKIIPNKDEQKNTNNRENNQSQNNESHKEVVLDKLKEKEDPKKDQN